MTDTDIVIILNSGTKIPVVYPQRIGREYETPWLNDIGLSGSREWNIDIGESLREVKGSNPRFIVGRWGTGYLSKLDVDHVIPFASFSGIESLSNEDSLSSAAARAREMNEQVLRQTHERLIHGSEFDALVARVKTLEEKKP